MPMGTETEAGMATCPICGTETDQRVGVMIGGEWRYCWLCECGHRWDWVSQGAEESNMLLNEWLNEEEQGASDEAR